MNILTFNLNSSNQWILTNFIELILIFVHMIDSWYSILLTLSAKDILPKEMKSKGRFQYDFFYILLIIYFIFIFLEDPFNI